MDLSSIVNGLTRNIAMSGERTIPRGIRAAANQYYDPGRIVSSAKPLMSPSTARFVAPVLGGIGIVGRTLNPFLAAQAVVDQAQTVFNPQNNIVTAVQNLGTSIQNINKPLAAQGEYAGTDPFAVQRNERIRSAKFNAQYGNNPIVAGDQGMWGRYAPAEYRYQDGMPAVDDSLQDSSAISGGSLGSSAAERAYLEEKRRATQLAEQDQLSKKYKVADLTKAYNTAATPEEKEKIGLQIWATTNPRLAERLKPGQLGYTEAQTAIQAQSPLGAFTQATGDMQYAEKMNFGLASPTGAPAFNLKTPLSGVPVPPVDQVGISEAFTKGAVPVTDAFKAGAFKPDLSQTQLALLKQAFERGLK